MKTLTIKLLLLAGLLATGSSQAAEMPQAQILHIQNPPQANGIHMGDVLERTIEIALAPPLEISRSVLPVKGTATDGMELVDVQLTQQEHGESNRYRLVLRYQVFAQSGSAAVMQLPAQRLAVTGAQQALTINIPAWRFWYSPLVAVSSLENAKASLQPSHPPVLLDIASHNLRLYGYAALLVIGFIGLVYVNADKRWLPFMGGPFARAHRKIKRLPQSQQKQALFHLHQAFNQTFGASLFTRNLHQFLERHPGFASLSADIQAFFERSNRVLFAGHEAELSVAELASLSKRLRDRERGL